MALALGTTACSRSNDAEPPAPSGPDEPGDDLDTDDGDEDGFSCEGSGISKTPWVLAIDETSAKIRWEACREGTDLELRLTPEGGGDSTRIAATSSPFEVTETYKAPLSPRGPHDWAGTYYMQEAKLEGLSPSTCYQYEVLADSSAKGRFCTAREPGESFKFMVIGDTNPTLGQATSRVLDASLPANPDFILHMGDLQYYDSLVESWASWWPRMQPLLAQGGFFPAVGNHEYEKPNEFELYYKRFFDGAGFDGTTDYYRFQSGGVWFFSLNSEIDLEPDSEQGKWLLANLEDAQKQPGFRFSVVYVHRPWMSCGERGGKTALREAYAPIFKERDVKVALFGHIHAYERFEKDGLTYITSGGGGAIIGKVKASDDRPDCAYRKEGDGFHHAVIFEVTDDSLKGTTIDDQGEVRDEFGIALD